MNKNTLIVLSLLASFNIFSKTIIVSDVDDTIKMSGVKNGLLQMVSSAFRTKIYFKGMPELFHKLLTLDNDSQIVYLSNAPKWLMNKSHKSLLAKGGFPQGQMLLKTNRSSSTHKLAALRKLIQDHQPDQMILIGDIGEHDAEFYHKIAKENKDIRFHQFIRLAYSGKNYTDKLHQSQIMFVTPIEIATYFNKLNQDNKFDHIIENITKYLIERNRTMLRYRKYSQGGPKYFPRWLDCSSYVWPFKGQINDPTIESYLGFLQKRCR